MTTTIYDVAARAGVSIKSVSRVLNGEPNVSSALKKKVDVAVSDLGYRRNMSARSLAGSSSSIIAALVDADLTIEHWKSGRGNDYLSRLELGALMECRQADYHLMIELIDHGSSSLERDLNALLSAIRPEGVLLTPPNSDHPRVLDVLDTANVPYARISPERELDRGICVSLDETQAAFDVTEHLINLGHTCIAHVSGPPSYGASRLRQQGFAQAMKQHRLQIEPSWQVIGDFTFSSGVEAGERLMANSSVTAIFAANDDMALGVLQSARGKGLDVPGDLSVAGFDDTPSALFGNPPLTTIRQPVAEMAAAASRLLVPRLAAQIHEDKLNRRITVPYDFVVRASTGHPKSS